MVTRLFSEQLLPQKEEKEEKEEEKEEKEEKENKEKEEKTEGAGPRPIRGPPPPGRPQRITSRTI